MKFKELKNKSEKELQKLLVDSREKLRELRFKSASDQLKNVREVRELKKTIARILFFLNQQKQQNSQTSKKDEKDDSDNKKDASVESKNQDKAAKNKKLNN